MIPSLRKVECARGATSLSHKVAWFGVYTGWLALLGAGIVLVTGPVVALIGLLLPFAMVGGLAYGSYHLVQRIVKGRTHEEMKAKVEETAAQVRDNAVLAAQRLRQAVARVDLPAVGPRVTVSIRRAGGRVRWLGGVIARTALEVGAGAAVGAALAALAAPQFGWTDQVALGAGIGAVAGFVVGGPRRQPQPVEIRV
jgi:hypothetical protein